MSKTLTVAKLKRMQFVFSMHLNRGREHDLVKTNHEYGVCVWTTSRKPNYVIVRRVLYADVGGKRVDVDLMVGEYDAQLEQFCKSYNEVVPDGR